MTDDNIKEVINRTSIVDIINSTIPLKKKGNNYFGLSPFKKEKTPSFSVNEEKKIFHCFSTGEHGNVIDFLIKVKGYDFKDALNELASKAGVELSYKSSKINSTIYEINQFAKELFHSNLLQSKICMDYLIYKRKFTQETLDTTGYQKPELILVIASMVRHKVAKNVKEAIAMLDEGKHDPKELLQLVEAAARGKLPKKEEENSEHKVNVR